MRTARRIAPALLVLVIAVIGVGLLSACNSGDRGPSPTPTPKFTPRPATTEDSVLVKEALAALQATKSFHLSIEMKTNSSAFASLSPGQEESSYTCEADVESSERCYVKGAEDGKAFEAAQYDGMIYLKKNGRWVEIVQSSWSDDRDVVRATKAIGASRLESMSSLLTQLEKCESLLDFQGGELVGGAQVKHFACSSHGDSGIFGVAAFESELWVDPTARRVHKLAMRMTVELSQEPDMYVWNAFTISRHNEAVKVDNPVAAVGTPTPRPTMRQTVPAPLCGAWEAIEGPRMGNDGDFEGVAAVSPTDVWVVGSKITGLEDGSRVDSEAVTAHWDGKSWRLVPVPEVRRANEGARLKAVAALSGGVEWAVGYTTAVSGETQPGRAVILRWDGSAWKNMPVPDPGSHYYALYGVAALSPKDAWAVGSYGEAEGQGRPWTLHWNGSDWSMVPNSVSWGMLSAVTALSPGDVWAVGTWSTTALIMHYDGRGWVRMPVERVGDIDLLQAVAAASPEDVWAVGHTNTRNSRDAHDYLVMRWNGKSWASVTLPFPPRNGLLTGVAATSPRNVWVTGARSISAPSGVSGSIALHWDGTTWVEVGNPRMQADQRFEAVAAVSDKEIWAVGGESEDSAGYGEPEYGFYSHFTATQPCVQPSPTVPAPVSPAPVVHSVPDAGRTGNSGEMGPGKVLGVGWKLNVADLGISPGETGSSPPAAALLHVDGTLYVVSNPQSTSDPNYLCALDPATGRLLWKLKLESRFDFDTSPVVAEGTLYIGTERYVLAVDAKTHTEKWRFTPQTGRVKLDPVVIGAKVLVATSDYFYALDRETGREKWRTKSEGRAGAPVVSGGVLFASSSGSMIGLDAQSGQRKWIGALTGSIVESYAASSGMAFIASSSTNASYSVLRAVDLQTGIEKWTFNLPGTMYHSGPAFADGVVYAGNGNGPGYFVAVDSASGKEKWHFQAESSYVGDPLVAGGVLYFGSGEANGEKGYVHALDAPTGKEKWAFETDAPVPAMPAAGDGMLFFVTEKGSLYALR